MVILALETATRAGSLALYDRGACVASAGDPARTHGTRLPAELLSFARAHGHAVADVDLLAVVTGPGSFTGLRIGLAAVQGVALATNRRVVPVPTFDAMADAWLDVAGRAATRLVTCLDGARGDVFYAVYDTTGTGTPEGVRNVMLPAVATPEEAARHWAELGRTAPVTVIGDGAARHHRIISAWLPDAVIDASPLNLALGAVRIAARGAAAAVAPHALRPIYVRRPDAELARERARSRSREETGSRDGPDVTIELAVPGRDLAAVAALQRRSFTNAWGAEAIQWELEHTDVARLYVARSAAGDIVAYCACWIVFDELHINSLAVDDAWRRRGVARTLLEHVLREAAAAGARGATLEVRRSNHAARALYEGLAFRVEGVRRDYYQNPREDGLILWRRDLAGLPAAG